MRTVASKRRLQRPGTPLKVLQQPIQAGMRKVFDLRRLLFVVGLTLIVLLLPTPAGLSLEGHKAIALFVFSGLILALEPAPLPIVALLVPIVQIALGVDDAGGAFAPFGTPVVFLIMGSLFLAEALRKRGLTRRLADQHLALDVSDAAMTLLGEAGFDPVYGARPLKRAIQQRLENPLAQAVLAGEFSHGDTVVVDAAAGKMVLTARHTRAA